MSIEDAAIVEMIRGKLISRSFMDYCGVILVVLPFTDGCLSPMILIPKDRSTVKPQGPLFCGIVAIREIFNCGGTSFLMSFHIITVAKLYCTLSAIYIWSLEKATFVLAEMWGPRSSVAVICVDFQLGVQNNGHPVDAYLERSQPSR